MIFLILPAYNEEKDLVPLLERVKQALPAQGLEYCVLLVNDGSTDSTLAVSAELCSQHAH